MADIQSVSIGIQGFAAECGGPECGVVLGLLISTMFNQDRTKGTGSQAYILDHHRQTAPERDLLYGGPVKKALTQDSGRTDGAAPD